MKKCRIAAVLILVQAIVLPILLGSLSGFDRGFFIVLQVIIATLCGALFLGKRWAILGMLGLMAIQIPTLESERVTVRVVGGSSLSLGLLTSESWLDSRLSINLFTGYVFNGAYSHAPMKRMLTDGRSVTGPFMVNLATVPTFLLLLGCSKEEKKNRANKRLDGTSAKSPPSNPGQVSGVPHP